MRAVDIHFFKFTSTKLRQTVVGLKIPTFGVCAVSRVELFVAINLIPINYRALRDFCEDGSDLNLFPISILFSRAKHIFGTRHETEPTPFSFFTLDSRVATF